MDTDLGVTANCQGRRGCCAAGGDAGHDMGL
jgi:hypothetical protein